MPLNFGLGKSPTAKFKSQSQNENSFEDGRQVRMLMIFDQYDVAALRWARIVES